jgi:3D (Asp-Asp-Asp) domain-containing protein
MRSLHIALATTLLVASAPAQRAHHLRKTPALTTHTAAVVVHWKTTRVLVTAYVVGESQGCYTFHDRTASGTVAAVGTVAVDPHVFALGRTIFRIPGYGYGIARDTGAYIRGRHIDIVLRSCAHALRWGARLLSIAYATK